MTDEQPSAADKARKERSPSFPFISLKRAVERAAQMAEAHRRSPARLATVGETWGYGAKSSGLLQTVAALKAFGLVEDIGGGVDRRIQLSDLAWRILHDARANAKQEAIREAATKPRLIAEYAAHWLPARPSDSHCLSELHLDRGFTIDAAKLFLKVFDETVNFAHLTGEDESSHIFLNENFSDAPTEPEVGHSPLGDTFRRAAPPSPLPAITPRSFTIEFGPGILSGTFNLEWREDAERMIEAVNAMKGFLKVGKDSPQ